MNRNFKEKEDRLKLFKRFIDKVPFQVNDNPILRQLKRPKEKIK